MSFYWTITSPIENSKRNWCTVMSSNEGKVILVVLCNAPKIFRSTDGSTAWSCGRPIGINSTTRSRKEKRKNWLCSPSQNPQSNATCIVFWGIYHLQRPQKVHDFKISHSAAALDPQNKCQIRMLLFIRTNCFTEFQLCMWHAGSKFQACSARCSRQKPLATLGNFIYLSTSYFLTEW